MASESSIHNNAFVTAQWTRVLEARGNSPEAKAALSELCAAYYAPVFAFIRRNARDEDAARDLKEFFVRLLAEIQSTKNIPIRQFFQKFLQRQHAQPAILQFHRAGVNAKTGFHDFLLNERFERAAEFLAPRRGGFE